MPSTIVWYCCACGFGPCNNSLDSSCPSCHVDRCYNCRTAKISNRYNCGLPGDAEASLFHKAYTYAGPNADAYNISPPSAPFNPPQQHLERASLALTPNQRPPTCFHTGNHHSAENPSIGEIFKHGGLINSSPITWYCCQCNDGPKLYDIQVSCINCDHVICSFCKSA